MPQQREVSIRVICINPPLSATTEFGLQDKSGAVSKGETRSDGALVFDVVLKISIESDKVGITGEFAHGSPKARFLYLTLRAMDADGKSQIVKRIKIQLGSISAAQIEEVMSSDAVLQVAVDGRGAATVPLLDGGWKVVSTA
ncbi:MAG: hypothetical protein KF726_08780 [Anaerolineae bacterium]|nr:hypothetical protein [Anaerolineae bacterium]